MGDASFARRQHENRGPMGAEPSRSTWPSQSGEQTMMMHLDIGVADLESGVLWAIQQGARLADHQPQDGVRVMIDPDGHPFCIFSDDTL
jgi:hypothetical protein